MKTLVSKLKNNYFANIFMVSLSIWIFMFYYSNYRISWLIFSLFSILGIIKKPKLIFLGILLALMGIVIHLIREPRQINVTINDQYKVVKSISMGSIIKVNNENVLLKNAHFDNGDILKVFGKVVPVYGKAEKYLLQNEIKNIIVRPQIKAMSLNNDFRNNAIEYITEGETYYKTFAPLMLLGIKNENNEEIYQIAIQTNIVHLFVISGFHISLFFLIIQFSLGKVIKEKRIVDVIGITLISIYLYLLKFPISATRASLLVLLSSLNKHFLKSKFSSIDILAFVMLSMFLFKPIQITSYSFILTFLATFSILFINQIEFKKNWLKIVAIAVGVYLSTLPIIISLNQFFSITGFFIAIILSPTFVLIYSMSLFLFPFKGIMNHVYFLFDFVLRSFNEINIIVDVPRISQVPINFIYLSILMAVSVTSFTQLFKKTQKGLIIHL